MAKFKVGDVIRFKQTDIIYALIVLEVTPDHYITKWKIHPALRKKEPTHTNAHGELESLYQLLTPLEMLL